MVRCKSLDMSGLAAQEKHGKRLDHTSQKRVIRDESPVVYRGLDLRNLYDAHIDGVKQNSAAKRPVLHFIVRFPPQLLHLDEKHFSGDKSARQKMMVRQAVAFINATHGGDAVFAARLDRDEAGETIVDVFAAPRYEKRTKRTKPDEQGVIWASATKFGKELCEKHQSEIQRRHSTAKGRLTAPRHVGIALNIEWRSWFQRVNDLKLAPKIEKQDPAPDRLETEQYKRLKEEENRLAEISKQTAREKYELKQRAQSIDARERKVSERETFLKSLESSFQKATKRVVSLLSMMSETLGISVPSKISDALSILETEAIERADAWVAVERSSSTEDPFDEVGPGL